MTEKFVLIAKMRSGTHFLKSVIGGHPDIHCYPEVLPSLGPEQFHSFWLKKIREDEKNILPHNRSGIFDDYLTCIFSSLSGKKAVGLDIKYYQVPLIPQIFKILKKHNVKIIHLMRRNLLKHMISIHLHLEREKLGRSMHGTKKVPPVKVIISPNVTSDLTSLKAENDNYKFLLEQNFDYLELYYEDFFENSELESATITPSVLDIIYDFLNVEEKLYNLNTKLKKTNPAFLLDLISNYEEVVNFLSGTPWENLLEETTEDKSEASTF